MTPLFSRRRFLHGLGASLAVAAGAGAYGYLAEPRWLACDRVSVTLRGRPAGPPLRILHVSDLHVSRWVTVEFVAEAISLGLAQRPDIAVLTGDFFTGRLADAGAYAAVLRRLAEAVPTFASLGNHDGGRWADYSFGLGTPEQALWLLRTAKIPCLINQARVVTVRGRRWQLLGLGDLWAGMCDPGPAFSEVRPLDPAPRIVLSHNPDTKELLRPFNWDLMLCGHTHGGQVRFPFFGAPFAPVEDRRFIEGLHAWEGRWLYITRGVGNLHGVRLNCRPQVSIVDVT
jgi:uncharacterized protein